MDFAQEALDANYEIFGKTASYIRLSGPPIPCLVIPDQQADISSFNQAQIRSEKNIFNLRNSEFGKPEKTANIVFKGIIYKIKDVNSLDPENLEWQVECTVAT